MSKMKEEAESANRPLSPADREIAIKKITLMVRAMKVFGVLLLVAQYAWKGWRNDWSQVSEMRRGKEGEGEGEGLPAVAWKGREGNG